MAAQKHIDRICLIGTLLSLLISLLFMNGQALGLQSSPRLMGYEAKLFDTSQVHTIDIVMDDWDSFIDICENEEYASCAVVIDNEAYKNVGIRAKGNTSLSTVSRLNSDRYSFKIEFDHYDNGKTYHGLDKLSLNNVIQDNTYMKDYLTYQMMAAFGASAPLCSYVYITVNGEDWGLYLAVEGVEDSFLQRNYGQDHGELYKPDSSGMGGGRGNGRDFDMNGFMDDSAENAGASTPSFPTRQPFSGQENDAPTDLTPPGQSGGAPMNFSPDGQEDSAPFGKGFGGNMGGGMSSSDTKLQYIDDDPDSYANIFDNAKTDITEADQTRLIQALKALSEGGDVSNTVDIDQVLRYFVVHNYVVNGDSYTGSIVHNYYLYEQDGTLSMLPWDYNLAFGTFQGGSASSAVNDPIDTPLSVSGSGDRPMADWIFSSEEYTQLYHQYFEEFLSTVDPAVIIENTYTLIAPYVERDPTKFCTCEEFEAGVTALKTFCTLRTQSVSGQLSGAIPSTSAGQSERRNTLVDTSSLTLSNMGTMNNGGFDRNGAFGRNEDAQPAFAPEAPSGNGGETDRHFSGNGQRPDTTQAGNFGGFPGGPAGQAPADSAAQTVTTLILLGVSVLALLAGLVIAFKFKR